MGFNTTKADAVCRAAALAKECGQGWTAHVHENLGWHWSAVSPCGRMNIYNDNYYNFPNDNLSCYTVHLNAPERLPGGRWVGSGATPTDAIRDAVQQGVRERESINAILCGLEGT